MLPGIDGLSLCKEIRTKSDLPIIMITARVEEIDRLLGLELGADDYISKPFSPREVVARTRAVLRRSLNQTESHSFFLDDARNLLHINGAQIEMTAVEFQILKMLNQRVGHIYSRDQLMSSIYSDNRIVNDRTIDSHIKKIRAKIKPYNGDSELILSVYGLGYKLEF